MNFLTLRECAHERGVYPVTRHALQRFTEWLDIAGEATDLVERARSRKRIVQAIAKETNVAGSSRPR